MSVRAWARIDRMRGKEFQRGAIDVQRITKGSSMEEFP